MKRAADDSCPITQLFGIQGPNISQVTSNIISLNVWDAKGMIPCQVSNFLPRTSPDERALKLP